MNQTKTFQSQVEISEGTESGKYNAALIRFDGNTPRTLVNLHNITAADVYWRFGIEVEGLTPLSGDVLTDAKDFLRKQLDNLPKSQLVSRDEIVNTWLDLLNILGTNEEAVDDGSE